MPGRITLSITTGPRAGKAFVFEQHDTLLLGRRNDCQVCLPEDTYISRHHFILEVNPPEICLRELGSLHGTFINGQKVGGRQRHETPEEGYRHVYEWVELRDGDEVRAGKTTFLVRVERGESTREARLCLMCWEPIVDADALPTGAADHLCAGCRAEKQDASQMLRLTSRSLTGTAFQLQEYTELEELRKGEMGVVYLARLASSGQLVVIKVLPARAASDERARQRFLREMEITCALRHRHIITHQASGSLRGFFYFVLEYCEGGSVADLMEQRGGKLALNEAGPILLQTLKALAYAHSQHFVHRDLKPQNILLRGSRGSWSARLADLGLAKNFEEAGFSGLTLTSDRAGTGFYMPHEQMSDYRNYRPASDVWAMGATCYHILTGAFPRDHLATTDQLKLILEGEAIPIRERDPRLPQAVAAVIDRALAYQESARYQHAGEMYAALKEALK